MNIDLKKKPHNDYMKRFLLIFTILFLMAQFGFSAPNYDPNHKTITYDVSYNVNLRNKLEDDFHKKYIVKQTATGITYARPSNAYYNEVLVPYYQQQKRMEDCPIVSK